MSQWRIFRETHGLPYVALKFLSGSQAGQEAPLKEGDDAIMGRGRETDIVLDDRKASRQHARIYLKDGQLYVRDLGSVNGTLVNGAKVELKPVYPGDLIQIANVRMKLESRKRFSEASWRWWRDQKKLQQSRQDQTSALAATMDNVLSGDLSSVSIDELLTLLESKRKTGLLALDTVWGVCEIAFRDGVIVAAGLPTGESAPTLDAIARFIVVIKGEFEFCAGDPGKLENAISLNPDDLRQAATDLPEIFAELESLAPSIDTYLKRADADAIEDGADKQTAEILHLAATPTTIANIFDHFAGNADDAAKILVQLIKDGRIKLIK